MDVGGGLGHDLEEMKLKHPSVRGRLVLQDKPEVIAQFSKISDSIDLTAHEFSTPQRVNGMLHNGPWSLRGLTSGDPGARAYYLHSILHDWDEASRLRILRNIVSAMEQDIQNC